MDSPAATYLLYQTNFAERISVSILENRSCEHLLTEMEYKTKVGDPIPIKAEDIGKSLSELEKLYPLHTATATPKVNLPAPIVADPAFR